MNDRIATYQMIFVIPRSISIDRGSDVIADHSDDVGLVHGGLRVLFGGHTGGCGLLQA